MAERVIAAKTRMRKIPKTCKDCSLSRRDYWNDERMCVINGMLCPLEVTESGKIAYCKPSWCPLVEIERGGLKCD